MGKSKKPRKIIIIEKSHDDPVECQVPQAIRENPPGIPPIVPPPFPQTAYGLATIDTGNKVLYVGGLQGFLPNGELAPTVADRVRIAYDSMYAIARYYGASPLDALRLVLYVNPDSPIAIQEFPNLNHHERFVAIRAITNAYQAPIYGNNAPARTIVGVTAISLDDVFEIEGTFILPRPLPQCTDC
jgi:enamine deaminase RidA (YjgF/YER057c/UK114 family)